MSLALNANIFLARGRRPANQSTADDCGQLAWLAAELARAAEINTVALDKGASRKAAATTTTTSPSSPFRREPR